MKNILKSFIEVIILALVLSACSNPISSTPTQQPTNTALPKNTSTPLLTARPTLVMGQRQRVDAGGYSLQVPGGFETKIRASQVAINNKDNTILISMAVSPRKTEAQTVAALLDGLISSIGKDVKDLKAGKPYPAAFGGRDGLAADVSGTLFGEKSSGRAVVFDTGKPGFFIAFAFASDGANGNQWEKDGAPVFDAVMNSIQFFAPVVDAATGICTISTDATYGYTSENPIKVGGDDFDGPPRERAYLDNLAGPKGEKISYVRRGSNTFGDVILDIFEITGLGKPMTLYIDEYSYTEPLAPVGFTCIAAFPLTQP